MKNINRRKFIQKTSMASAAVGVSSFIANPINAQSTRPLSSTYMGGFAAPTP